MSVLAALRVVLGLETGPFQRGATQAQMEAQKLVKSVERTGKQIATVGAGISAGLTEPFAALMSQAIPAATDSAQSLAQVESALKSMGNAAGRTSEQLQEFASNAMHQSLYDDDDILRKVTANMLTFGNVSGEAFDRAQQAAVDLSARLGQDLQSSAIQIGKALNDPLKGLTALSKVGISFTKDQKAMIEGFVATGDIAKAQAIILAELERQFGGAAKAAHDATPNADMQHAWADFQETVGKVALDVLPKIIPPLTRMLDAFNSLSPGVQTFVVGTVAVAAALGPVLTAVGGAVSAFAGLAPILATVGGAIATFASVITAGAIPAIGSMIVALAPILVPLAAVAAAVAAVYYAWKHWDEIRPMLERAWAAVKSFVIDGFGKALEFGKQAIGLWLNAHKMAFDMMIDLGRRLYMGVKDWVLDKLNSVWESVNARIETVKNAFFHLYDAVVGHSYIPDMVDEIGQNMDRLETNMVQPATKATNKTKEAFRGLASDVSGILDRLFPVQAQIRSVLADIEKLDKAKAAGMLSDGAYNAARTKLEQERIKLRDETSPSAMDAILGNMKPLTGVMGDLPKVSADFKNAVNDNAEAAQVANVRIVQSFQDAARNTIAAIENMSNAIKGGGFLDILGSVLNLGLQLGSIGVFGKTVASNINAAKVPQYAKGTGYHSGGMAIVGENGPELVNLPRGSSVTPNGRFGPSSVQVVPSPYFDVVVDGRVQRAAPAIATVGAQAGSQMAQSRSAWRQQWSLA